MSITLPNYITGSYAVGTERFTVTDDSREEVLGPKCGPRRLEVRLFYPVSKEETEGKARMEMSEERVRVLQKACMVKEMPEGLVRPECYVEVPQAEGKFPLVIYNHGYGSGCVEGNTLLCCEMASNGYVVASIGHAYEASICEFEDGTVALYDKEIKIQSGGMKSFFAQMKLVRMDAEQSEVYAYFDELQKKYMGFMLGRLPEWGKDSLCVIEKLKTSYGDRIDFSKGIGATGHSFGGAVAYWLCQYSEEVTCGANIDGGVFGDYMGMVMKKPFLQIGCKMNRNFELKPLLNTEAPVRFETFEGMTHGGFTDMKFMYDPDSAKAKMVVGKMDGCEMHRRMADLHLVFFGEYLQGQNRG
ncbi:MAG: hypothetical protein IKT67_04970 [Lachnospiraceae bacterium]|nr:hypothetical protein [Lachnospiraceae bacterium]